MIKYNKKKFALSMFISCVFAFIIVGFLYTNSMIGETSIPYFYLLGSFFVTTILFDPFEYITFFLKKKNATKSNPGNIDTISIKYMIFMTLLIFFIASVVFFTLYLKSGYFYGIFSVIYILTLFVTVLYNVSIFIAKI